MVDNLPDWYAPEASVLPVAPAATAAPAAPDWYTPDASAAPPAPAAPLAATNPQFLPGQTYEPPRTIKNVVGHLVGADDNSPPTLADTAPSRATMFTAPIPEMDQQALFAAREKTTPGSPEYNDLTRKISQAQDRTIQQAPNFVPYGKAIEGLEAAAPAIASVAKNASGAVSRALDLQADFPNTPIGQYQPTAQATVSAMGGAATPAQIGQNIIDKTGAWIAATKKAASDAFNSIEARMMGQPEPAPPVAPVTTKAPSAMQLPELTSAADRLAGDRAMADQGLPSSGSPVRSFSSISSEPAGVPQPVRVPMDNTLELLTTPKEGPPLDAPLAAQITARLNQNGARGLGETMPYPALKEWRTEVGAASAKDPSNGPLKQLYGALSQDMEAGLRAQGGDEAVNAFHAANEGFGETKDFIKSRLGIPTNETMTPESVYSAFAANPAQSASRLTDLVKAGVLNQDDIGAIARNWITKAGTNAEGHFDPVQLSRAVTQLQQESPEAVQLLFNGTPERAAAFKQGVAETNRQASVMSSIARANPVSSQRLDTIKKAAKGLIYSATLKQVPVLGPIGGELVGGILGAESGGAAAAGNPLYRLPGKPISSQMTSALLKALNSRAAGAVARGVPRAALLPPMLAQPTGAR